MGHNGILIKAGMRSGKLKIGNSFFNFFFPFGFGLTLYNEDQIFCIDIHIFLQKLSGAKFET